MHLPLVQFTCLYFCPAVLLSQIPPPTLPALQAPVFHSALYNLEPQMINKDTLSACNNAAWCMGEWARRGVTSPSLPSM